MPFSFLFLSLAGEPRLAWLIVSFAQRTSGLCCKRRVEVVKSLGSESEYVFCVAEYCFLVTNRGSFGSFVKVSSRSLHLVDTGVLSRLPPCSLSSVPV